MDAHEVTAEPHNTPLYTWRTHLRIVLVCVSIGIGLLACTLILLHERKEVYTEDALPLPDGFVLV